MKGQKAYNKNLILAICFSYNVVLKFVSPVNAPFANSLQLEQIKTVFYVFRYSY